MPSCFSCVRLFVTPGTVARQAPLSVGFSRQEYWSGLPCPLPGDLSNPGIESMSLMSPALAGGFFTTSATWEVRITPVFPPKMHTLTAQTPVAQNVTPRTVAHQAPLSMEFSRQEYWSGLPCPPPGDLPDPGIKPMSPVSPALAGGFFTTSTTWEAQGVDQ